MDFGRVENTDVLNIEEGGEKLTSEILDQGVISAHVVGHDSWQQVGFLLVTGFNCGYMLSFSNLMFAPVGWTWGITILLVVALYSVYANWLLAAFHFTEGKRFIRYRDLMGFVFGKYFYYTTWVLQFLTFILANMGFILLGGRALKEMNLDFSDSPLRLQYFIIMAGASYFTFSFLTPTMSAMRTWLAFSGVLTCIYVAALLVEVVDDGRKNPNRNYDVPGNKADKVFQVFAAISAVVGANSCGLLPEIQSTLRQPAVKNMRKALCSQFTVGLLIYYGVTIVGYWAYGASVSWYLPHQIMGPRWVKILINTTVFLQSVVSQNVRSKPIFSFNLTINTHTIRSIAFNS